LDTSRQTKNLNKLLIRILLHLQVEFSIDIQEFKLIIQQMMVMLFMEHLQMQLFLIQRPPL